MSSQCLFYNPNSVLSTNRLQSSKLRLTEIQICDAHDAVGNCLCWSLCYLCYTSRFNFTQTPLNNLDDILLYYIRALQKCMHTLNCSVYERVSIPCLSCAAGPEESVAGSLWHLQNLDWALMPVGSPSWHHRKNLDDKERSVLVYK